jgi:acyl-CoA dehydrogenase
MRQWVTRSLGHGGSPAVVTAIAKYHSTEMMREAVDHAMDVFGGRGIQLGPRNPIGLAYQGVPLGITVEGANIMTRSLIIFGQGSMRCHPYLFEEFQLLAEPDSPKVLEQFDAVLFRHIGYSVNRVLRALVHGWFGRWIDTGPAQAPAMGQPWYRLIDRFSAILAVTADVGLLTLGGKLKMRELLSARLGDTLSQLFIASSILKYHASLPENARNDLHAQYALHNAFDKAQQALLGFYENFPVRWLGAMLKFLAFPFGVPVRPVSDEMIRELGAAIMEPGPVRDAIGACCYRSTDEHDALGRLETTFQLLLQLEEPLQQLRKARRNEAISGETFTEELDDAIEKGFVLPGLRTRMLDYERLRHECLLTDVFDSELRELRGAA